MYSLDHPWCHNFEIFLISSKLLTIPYLILWCLLEICNLSLRCRISSWTSISRFVKTESMPTYFWAGYACYCFPRALESSFLIWAQTCSHMSTHVYINLKNALVFYFTHYIGPNLHLILSDLALDFGRPD